MKKSRFKYILYVFFFGVFFILNLISKQEYPSFEESNSSRFKQDGLASPNINIQLKSKDELGPFLNTFVQNVGSEIYDVQSSVNTFQSNIATSWSITVSREHVDDYDEVSSEYIAMSQNNLNAGGDLPGSIYNLAVVAPRVKPTKENVQHGSNQTQSAGFTPMMENTLGGPGPGDPDVPVPIDNGFLIILIGGVIVGYFRLKRMEVVYMIK